MIDYSSIRVGDKLLITKDCSPWLDLIGSIGDIVEVTHVGNRSIEVMRQDGSTAIFAVDRSASKEG